MILRILAALILAMILSVGMLAYGAHVISRDENAE